jgi:mannonate dehydratase
MGTNPTDASVRDLTNRITGPDRREFVKLAVGGALGASALLSSARTASAIEYTNSPGIKFSSNDEPANPTDDQLLFLNQIGIKYVNVDTTPDQRTLESFMKIKKRYAEAGIAVWTIGEVQIIPEIVLNLPGRDQKIEEYKQYLRNLSKAGLYYTTYVHSGNGIWHSGRETIRGAEARAFDMSSPNIYGEWNGIKYYPPLSNGRVFTEKEIWDNYTYFIKQVAPVAEEVGVRIGIHPEDPPVPMLAGVPRCIFTSFEGYKRALEIANSPNVGIVLCCGTWLEGGRTLMGKDPVEMIRYFGPEKIWQIHFRNISAPLPHFVETFIDNGYYDMYKIAKALVEVNYDGNVMWDHTPKLVGGRYAECAYGVAYMKALFHAAQDEAQAKVKA